MIKPFLVSLIVLISLNFNIAYAGDLEDNLMRQFNLLEISPCASRLRFDKIEGEWFTTCPNCAAVPAIGFYSQQIFDIAEEHAVNNSIAFTRILQISGTCS